MVGHRKHFYLLVFLLFTAVEMYWLQTSVTEIRVEHNTDAPPLYHQEIKAPLKRNSLLVDSSTELTVISEPQNDTNTTLQPQNTTTELFPDNTDKNTQPNTTENQLNATELTPNQILEQKLADYVQQIATYTQQIQTYTEQIQIYATQIANAQRNNNGNYDYQQQQNDYYAQQQADFYSQQSQYSYQEFPPEQFNYSENGEPITEPPPPPPPKKKADMYYDEILQAGLVKQAENVKLWQADTEKFQCFLNSSFKCDVALGATWYGGSSVSYEGACAPSFIIPGTAKSGTTSLYFYLVEHPQVHHALSGQFNKEVRFFAENWGNGAGWYMQQFPPITKNDFGDGKVHMINGEASPTYFYNQLAPALMRATIPNVKLIIVLRDPVERAYSDKMQLVANGIQYLGEPFDDFSYQIETFKACFETAKKNYGSTTDAFFSCYESPGLAHSQLGSHPFVMDSIYVYQIRHWLKFFPRNQLLFVKGEDMYTDPISVMNRVTKFLGLCEFDWAPHVKEIHNKRPEGYAPMTPQVKRLLVEFYHDFTQELYEELNYEFEFAPHNLTFDESTTYNDTDATLSNTNLTNNTSNSTNTTDFSDAKSIRPNSPSDASEFTSSTDSSLSDSSINDSPPPFPSTESASDASTANVIFDSPSAP